MNTKLLNALLMIESESGDQLEISNFVADYCEALDAKVEIDESGNIYATKGQGLFPCYCAHLDTVHPKTGDGIVLVTYRGKVTGMNPATMQQTGVGGDDKCGIYAALTCLESLDNCKVVFFTDEEIGCVGSGACNLDFFSDCKFVVSADRRGSSDFVTEIGGPLSSQKFLRDIAPILNKYGFTHCQGAMTDVMELRNRGVGVSVANVSAGYYNPHTSGEYIAIDELENVANMMIELANLKRRYDFDAPKSHHGYAPDELDWLLNRW